MINKNTCAILGATSDLGKALAYEFAQNKYNLVLVGRNIEKLKDLSNDLQIRYGSGVSLVELDALKFSDHSSILLPIAHSTNVAICCFGYLGDQKKAESDLQEAYQIMDVNYRAAVSMLSIFSFIYQSRKRGTIIGISSAAGERGRQSNYYYGSAKAGLTTFLDGMRNKLQRYSVHVITVKPGFLDTKMTAHLKLPELLTTSPKKAAGIIYKGMLAKKNTVYVLPVWRMIMFAIRNIPEFIFKKMKL